MIRRRAQVGWLILPASSLGGAASSHACLASSLGGLASSLDGGAGSFPGGCAGARAGPIRASGTATAATRRLPRLFIDTCLASPDVPPGDAAGNAHAVRGCYF